MTLAYILPESFTAKANVFVKAGRENAPEGSLASNESIRLTLTPEDVISESMIMLSRPSLEYAVITKDPDAINLCDFQSPLGSV